MNQQQPPYDITPEPQPEGGEKFCPFGLAASAGPLGKLSMHRPPCDPKNCALGDHKTNLCAIWQIPPRLTWLKDIAEEFRTFRRFRHTDD